MDETTPGLPLCADCPAPVVRKSRNGPIPKRCPDCSARYHRDHHAEYQRDASLRKFQQNGRWYTCSRCDLPFRAPGRKGPLPKWCPTCLPIHNAEYVASRAAPVRESLTCPDCGTVVPLARKGYSRRRCDPCAAAARDRQSEAWSGRHHDYVIAKWRRKGHRRRARKRGVDAERFDEREVFERDRWRCGICHRRVSRTARYPDPGSASLDHVVPLSEGGSHTRANTRCTHLRCNTLRNNKGGGEQLALIG